MLERWAVAVVLVTGAGGCARSSSAATSADTLVLELGGSNAALRSAMQKLGVEPKPLPVADAPPAPADQPKVEPVPEPPPEPAVLEVKLEKNQTLVELARRHLGSPARWREIAEFNHFDEARLNRLREGTIVRIPLRKDR